MTLNFGNIILKNNNSETVEGFALISKSPMSVVDVSVNRLKPFQKKETDGEYMVWFDFGPDEVVKIIQ